MGVYCNIYIWVHKYTCHYTRLVPVYDDRLLYGSWPWYIDLIRSITLYIFAAILTHQKSLNNTTTTPSPMTTTASLHNNVTSRNVNVASRMDLLWIQVTYILVKNVSSACHWEPSAVRRYIDIVSLALKTLLSQLVDLLSDNWCATGRCGSRIFERVGGEKWDFANIAPWSRDSGQNFGHELGIKGPKFS